MKITRKIIEKSILNKNVKSLCIFILLTSFSFCYAKEVVIRSGTIWRDTRGEVIQAHGIGMLQVGKTIYWYGEDRTSRRRSSSIRCYASQDLANWEFKNVVFRADDYANLTGANLERPKVIYCDATKKYVMWVHKEGLRNYTDARVLVATCDTPDGKFTYVSDFRPMGNESRDITLFKDDDGSAYLFSAANNNADLMCYKLTPDYLNVEKVWIALKGQSREAPAVFKRNGRYYLITSACTGWGPNGNLITSAPNAWGPYGKQIPLCSDDTWNTYCSQSAFVLPIKGTKATNYVFMSDRWKGWNLADSRYIFLPIPFTQDGQFQPIQWGDEWKIDVETGECSFPIKPTPASNNIAKGLPAVASISNRTNGNEAHMAVDGDLRTKWCANDGEYPHWLKIDLGSIKKIDKSEIVWELRNGTIYFYQIDCSPDGNNWKTVVDKRSNTDTNQIQIDLINTDARFFRLTVHGYEPPRRGGYAWASLFEWRLFSETENVALRKPITTDS